MNLASEEIYGLMLKELKNEFKSRRIKIKLRKGKLHDIFNVEIENASKVDIIKAYSIVHKWQVEEVNSETNYWKVNYLVTVLPMEI